MTSISVLAETGSLIGEPSRAAILLALIDGRSLTAGELARVAGISPTTASGHLSRLVEAGFLAVTVQGRHRYFRIGSAEVAGLVETMMNVAGLVGATRSARPVVTGPRQHALRRARICYDHLAGEIAVGLAGSLAASGYVAISHDGAELTAEGAAFLHHLGLDLDGGSGRKRQGPVFCRPCMDWSERRPHIAGIVGRSLLRLMLDRQWLRRTDGSREIAVTPLGTAALQRHFGLAVPPRPNRP